MKLPFTGDTISPGRLISFSDGVFAIAVTLLVFNLKVPELPEASAHRDLPKAVAAMVPHFVTYVVSFILVAVYWTAHHRVLNLVKHVDGRFIWMNMLYLLMVSFIPFPSALMGAYPDELFSFVFYVGSMVLVTVMSLSMWAYASYRYRLISPDLPRSVIRHYFMRPASALVIFLLAIALAFLNLRLAQYFIFILFPIHRLIRWRYTRQPAGAATEPSPAA